MSYFDNNNSFMNNNNTGFGFGGGVGVPPVYQKPTMENPAMEGKNAELLKGTSRGVFEVTDVEAATALCTHKDTQNFLIQKTGNVDDNGFPMYYCNYCREQFPVWDNCSAEDVQKIVNNTVWLLQNVKLLGVDLAGDFLSVYAQMIPYIKKLPKVYEVAVNSFTKFCMTNTNSYSNNNGFAVLNGILGGNYNFGNASNPAMNNGWAQQQQYSYNGYPQQPMNNQYAYNNGYGQQPMNNQYNTGFGQQQPNSNMQQQQFGSDPMQNNMGQRPNSEFTMRSNSQQSTENKKAFED